MTSTEVAEGGTADWLLTPEAIRSQCQALYDRAEADQSENFSVHIDRLGACAAEVIATIRKTYPDLDIPPHARWRHFVMGERDRWADHVETLGLSPLERARVECELAIISVLLDAGAGETWRYTDPSDGQTYARSEGLALASLNMFIAGAFGGQSATSAWVLSMFSQEILAHGFQVSAENPLEGLAGRAALIASLGDAVTARPDIFGQTPRLGQIADTLLGRGAPLPAREILITVLDAFGSIWPGAETLNGRPLGDCWMHHAAPNPGLVPFHKLSQWLSYSLIEPLQRAGASVTDLDALTGLAEYRNGGLFLDTGVIALRDPDAAKKPQPLDSALIVEWRALTVVLLDRVAEAIRKELGKTPEALPLAAVLEGGTWATGRRLAADKRPGGIPPISIQSTGTVF